MRRLFKYSLRFIIILLVLLIVAYFIVLHTQFGARWIINYFTQQSAIKIKMIEGTLANKINLIDITFDDQNTVIKAKQVSYQIKEIHWFSRKLVFDKIEVQQVKLELSETPTDNLSSTAFEEINLPIEIEVHAITIDEILYQSEQTVEKFKQINLGLQAKNKNVNVSELSIQHQNLLVKGSGSLQLMSNFPFDMTTNWSIFNKDNLILGQGRISGDMTQITIKQTAKSNQSIVNGEMRIDAMFDLEKARPQLNVTLASDKLIIENVDQTHITIEKFTTRIIGSLDAYKLTLDFKLFYGELERTAISFNGIGNLESIDFKEIRLKNSQGTVNVPTVLKWSSEISAISKFELKDINPSVYLPKWPGLVNGNANLSLLLTDGDYLFSVEDAHFDGILKQQDFSLTGNIEVNPLEMIVNQAQLIMGNNKVDINAVVKDQKIEADFKATFNDLSFFDINTQGIANSTFKIKGDLKNPEIIGQANIKNAKYQDYQFSSLDIKANGNWLDNISIQAMALGITTENKSFNSIKLDINGNKDKHNVTITLDDEIISSELLVNGSLSNETHFWMGQIRQHELLLKNINSTWKLKDIVNVEYNYGINLSKACWINQKTNGGACLDLTINTDTNNHKINLDLNKLDIGFLKIFLPKDFIVDGNLDGYANIQLIEDDVNIVSNINLLDGEIEFFKNSKLVYKAKTLKASLITKRDNHNSKVYSSIRLDDGSNLNFNMDLFKSENDQIEIKGDINGRFTNTQYLASLSEEIEEMNGDFNIKGSVKGPISDLIINLDANQNQGYLMLSQTKTKIENMNFQLHHEPNQDIDFNLDGSAGKGHFKSTGQIILNKTTPDTSWEINARIQGENMRLLTLPELELDISPNLDIKADNNSTHISGNIKIPHAWLKIKQLPDSAISSSPDVIVHKSSNAIEDSDEYPVIFDVTANIVDKVKVDVLGLKSDLKGSLKVSNTENSRTNAYGSLELFEGKYTIYGQTLDISKGEFVFNGAIENPTLDVIASRKSISGDVTAGVELGGTINTLQSSLYSDPLLPDLEILSYILSGRGLNEESDTNSQQLAQAAILLGLKKSSSIFSEIQSQLGIDVLTIKDGTTSKEGSIEAGKQFNENLYVGYNQGLFNRIGFWVLRYQINKALRLETTQGENQSVDLIYVRKKK